jgi:hypothetical protein
MGKMRIDHSLPLKFDFTNKVIWMDVMRRMDERYILTYIFLSIIILLVLFEYKKKGKLYVK